MENMSKDIGVLFADISGSTAMYETLGDAQALRLISRSFNEFHEIISARGGQLIKTVGDELFCSFPSADEAVLAASDMQLAVSNTQNNAEQEVAIRVGVNFGPVIEAQGDLFGDTVNVASRIVGLANPGQVFATWQTVNAVAPFLRSVCRRLYSISLKGRAERVTVYEVVWRDGDDLTILGGPRTVAPTRAPRLRLSYKGAAWTVEHSAPLISMGRGRENNIVVQVWRASRHHATITLRGGKFVLTDHSSNGTFLLLEDDIEMSLRREDLVLIGRGLLGLGVHPRDASQECISFNLA
jgi:class 3 adenylate cyclase